MPFLYITLSTPMGCRKFKKVRHFAQKAFWQEWQELSQYYVRKEEAWTTKFMFLTKKKKAEIRKRVKKLKAQGGDRRFIDETKEETKKVESADYNNTPDTYEVTRRGGPTQVHQAEVAEEPAKAEERTQDGDVECAGTGQD